MGFGMFVTWVLMGMLVGVMLVGSIGLGWMVTMAFAAAVGAASAIVAQRMLMATEHSTTDQPGRTLAGPANCDNTARSSRVWPGSPATMRLLGGFLVETTHDSSIGCRVEFSPGLRQVPAAFLSTNPPLLEAPC